MESALTLISQISKFSRLSFTSFISLFNQFLMNLLLTLDRFIFILPHLFCSFLQPLVLFDLPLHNIFFQFIPK